LFGLGPEKLVLLFVIVLIVMGPRRLPDVARGTGRAIGELRRLTTGLRADVQEGLGEPGAALSDLAGALRDGAGSLLHPADPPAPAASAPRATVGDGSPGGTSATGPVAPDDPGLN
jgi:Sec-independent protein translocase protein TatA